MIKKNLYFMILIFTILEGGLGVGLWGIVVVIKWERENWVVIIELYVDVNHGEKAPKCFES